jgi:site-specific recombinase XerD
MTNSSMEKTINKQELKDKLDLIINPINIVEVPKGGNTKSNDVIPYFDWYIDFFSRNIVPTTGRILSNGTIRTYKNSARFLKDYLDDRRIKKFTFDDITKDFYYDYIQYSQEQGYSKNYIGSLIQKLKTIIRSAFDDDLHSNNEFRKYYFKKFSEEINHPYLTEEEIQSLYNIKIDNEHLDTVRDIFVIACYTGLRIGDLMRFLKNPNI